MKRILFRADANPAIGTGDLASLVYLADTFRAGGWETFFLVRGYAGSLAVCRKYDVQNVTVIAADAPLSVELETLHRLRCERGLDALFFEITERPLSEYHGLPENIFKGCVCFDGLLPLGMDLVVDWDVAARTFFRPEEHPETEFLLGPEYVFLPPEFDMERVAARTYRDSVERILVSMGGADELDFTLASAKMLANIGVRAEVRFVLGPAYAGSAGLEAFLAGSGLRFSLARDVHNMFEEYMACDFALGAGGLTSSELAATRTPCALVALYEHQVARCKAFAEKSLAQYHGFRTLDPDLLRRGIEQPQPPCQGFAFRGKTEVLQRLEQCLAQRAVK